MKPRMDPDKGTGAGGGNPPGVHDLQPEGAPKPPPAPGPDLNALQKQLAEMQAREAQYIEAINKMAERMPGDEPPPREGEEDQLDPVLQKRVSEMLTPLQRKLAQQEDMIDQQMFMNLAASAGVSPEQVGEAEKQYQSWRKSGLRTLAYDLETRREVERTPTRQEALDFVLGRMQRGAMMKEAPGRSMQALRAQLLGQHAFEAGAGSMPLQRSPTSYAEVEALPIDQRLKKREEELDRTGF